MHKFFTKIAFCFAALVIMGMAGTSAFADGIIFVTPDHTNKLVPPLEVLSLQHHGNSTVESGGVSRVGGADNPFGDTSAGPHNVTVAYSSLNVTPGTLGILININENNGPNANSPSIHIDSLVLTAYDSNGNSYFIGSIENLSLDQIKPAQGSTTDYQFGLDAAAQARLQAALLIDPNLRLGLSGQISNVGGGPERFKFGALNGGQVPEPTTMVLLGTGLAGIAAKLRKRRKAARDEDAKV